MKFPRVLWFRENHFLLDRFDHRSERHYLEQQYLEMRLRRQRLLLKQRKTRRRKVRQRSGTNHRWTTTGVLFHHQIGDTNHPPEAEAIEATEMIKTEIETETEIEIETETETEEEQEDLPGGTRGHVAWVRLPNEDVGILDRPEDMAGIPCPGAGVAPSMIVTDLPVGDPCLRQRDVEKPILAEDRVRRGDSSVVDPDHAPLWVIRRLERIQSATRTSWRIGSRGGIRRRKLGATR